MVDALVLPVVGFKPQYIPCLHAPGAVRGRMDVQRRCKAGHVCLKCADIGRVTADTTNVGRTVPVFLCHAPMAVPFLLPPPASCLGGDSIGLSGL